jgi:quercetin dioxygenase-like cupin family protein
VNGNLAVVPVIRGGDRPALRRPSPLPLLQRLVDRDNGSEAMTVLVNTFAGDENVPDHTHDVEEILVVTRGRVTFTVGAAGVDAVAGDAVVVPPGTVHGIRHTGTGEATVIAVLASADVILGGG